MENIVREVKDFTKDVNLVISINKINRVSLPEGNWEAEYLENNITLNDKGCIIINGREICIKFIIDSDIRIFSNEKNSLDESHYKRLDLSKIIVTEVQVFGDNCIRLVYGFQDNNAEKPYYRGMVGAISIITESSSGNYRYIAEPMEPGVCW